MISQDFSIFSLFRDIISTLKPFSAKYQTMDKPIPSDPPVTTAHPYSKSFNLGVKLNTDTRYDMTV
jgi:hypothetical protein